MIVSYDWLGVKDDNNVNKVWRDEIKHYLRHMDTCLYCKEPITQTIGKRKRMFCSNYCRSRHWAKKDVVPDSWQDKYYTLKALYDPLLVRVAEQEKRLKDGLELYNNQTATIFKLQSEIDRLKPAADSWNQRMQSTVEAIEKAPKQVLTTTSNDITAEDMIKRIREEKVPKERDTPIGRKAWQMEQEERIRKIKDVQ